MRSNRVSISVFLLLICSAVVPVTAEDFAEKTYSVRLKITSSLPCENIPMDPMIDFTSLIQPPDSIYHQGYPPVAAFGVLNLNTIQVMDSKTGKVVPHALSEHFSYGDKGRVLWLIEDPDHTEYEIRFRNAAKRPPLIPQKYIPMIGVGDTIRYNAGVPRPSTMRYPSRLVDLTGDGKPDLVGALSHVYVPGWPYGCIVSYPRMGSMDKFEFGEMIRVRYGDQIEAGAFKDFRGPYLAADVVDLNRDELPDVLYTTPAETVLRGGAEDIYKYAHIYLNSGSRDDGGMPILLASGRLSLPPAHGSLTHLSEDDGDERWWGPIRAVDLDNDGSLDIVVGQMYKDESSDDDTSHFLKNTNPDGWPMQLAEPVEINSGRRACYYDLDGDGLLDAVGLTKDPKGERIYREDIITWRKNLGGDPPKFGKSEKIQGIDDIRVEFVSAVNNKLERGLLISTLDFFPVFFEQVKNQSGKPYFRRRDAVSNSAVMVTGDQASPYPCDWDGDGDWDLVVGGGHGWPRIIINEGTNLKPAFAEPREILSEGKPIRIFMTNVFPGVTKKFPHDMGYPFPSYIDWNADGLPDLMVPNLTNRVFWYKNIGTRQQPKFGPRQQVTVDEYPETPESLAATTKLLNAGLNPRMDRPLDPNQPFGWRARAGFGDLNGDGLMDMVHADGSTQKNNGDYASGYALFVQYRDSQGKLKLRKDRPVTLPDGSLLKAAVSITTQAFVADWDNDGLLDLICHWGPDNTKCKPVFVRNIGTKTDPKFDYPVDICYWGEPLFNLVKHGPYWAVYDVDKDGSPDLLAGLAYGNYAFYRRASLEMKERPKFVLENVKKLNR